MIQFQISSPDNISFDVPGWRKDRRKLQLNELWHIFNDNQLCKLISFDWNSKSLWNRARELSFGRGTSCIHSGSIKQTRKSTFLGAKEFSPFRRNNGPGQKSNNTGIALVTKLFLLSLLKSESNKMYYIPTLVYGRSIQFVFDFSQLLSCWSRQSTK